MKIACNSCGEPFEAKRHTAKFCSDRCKKRAQRGQVPGQVVPIPLVEPDGTTESLAEAVLRQLEEVGREGTWLGRQAVALARTIEGPSTLPNAVPGLSKELRAVMVEATAGVKPEVDRLDELRARRDKKRAG